MNYNLAKLSGLASPLSVQTAPPLLAMQTAPGTPADRSTEFLPVEGGGESASAGSLLVWAYLLMWLLLFGFIFATWQRQKRINQRLGRLEESLKNSDAV